MYPTGALIKLLAASFRDIRSTSPGDDRKSLLGTLNKVLGESPRESYQIWDLRIVFQVVLVTGLRNIISEKRCRGFFFFLVDISPAKWRGVDSLE